MNVQSGGTARIAMNGSGQGGQSIKKQLESLKQKKQELMQQSAEGTGGDKEMLQQRIQALDAQIQALESQLQASQQKKAGGNTQQAQQKKNHDVVDNENRSSMNIDAKRKKESENDPSRHPTSMYVNTLA